MCRRLGENPAAASLAPYGTPFRQPWAAWRLRSQPWPKIVPRCTSSPGALWPHYWASLRPKLDKEIAESGSRSAAEVARSLGVSLPGLREHYGALGFDAGEVRPDYVVCAGYKWLLGPYSLGFLWAAPEHRGGKPIEYNWIARAGAEDFARLVDYRDEYQPGARRFDVGERSNFILVPMLNAALDQILEWGVEAIETTLAARTADIASRAVGLGLGSAPAALRAGHFLGLRFPGGGLPAGLLAALAAEQVYVSVRGASMRVTPHLYNTDEDVDRLFAALERTLD